MRKNVVAGNWKMNLTFDEGLLLSREILEKTRSRDDSTGIILCTPFTHLQAISSEVDGSIIKTGAQNCSSEISGAFTGEVSVSMIKSVGASWVITGHSERRNIFGETNSVLATKTGLALKQGLGVIYCVGEVLEERDRGEHFKVVERQLREGLHQVSPEEMKDIIIAYEPVWAIGTGRTATPEQAQEMHSYIRGLISEIYSDRIAADTTILYGGSCKPSNAAKIFSMEDVDGGLIGGASLNSDDFCAIIDSFGK